MKGIIFIVLLSLIFCISHLPKYGSFKLYSYSDTFYLNAEDFDQNSTIHIQFEADNGSMSHYIYYEFSDSEPISYISSPSNILSPSSTGESSTSVGDIELSYTKIYYYNIERKGVEKYLFIYYYGFYGNYLKIENTRINHPYKERSGM